MNTAMHHDKYINAFKLKSIEKEYIYKRCFFKPHLRKEGRRTYGIT
jgi:hypothetical protein